MVLAFGIAAMGMYVDTKPRQVGVHHFTIEHRYFVGVLQSLFISDRFRNY